MRKQAAAPLLLILLVLAVVAPSAGANASQLLAHWTLDEAGQTLADASGGGSDGRLGISPSPDGRDPVSILGRVGNALRFDGVDDVVVVPDSARLEPQEITVQAWVRRAGSPGRWRYVVSKGSSFCERSAYGLYSAANGGLGFYVADDGDYTVSSLASAEAVWDGGWHLATGTFDGHRVRLYLDGVQVGHGAHSSGPIAYGSISKGLYLGSYRGSCELAFSGDIDEVELSDDARSSAAIAADYASTGPAPSGDAPLPPRPTPPSAPAGGAGGGIQPRAACYQVRTTSKRIKAGRRTRITATVRRRGKLAAKVKVVARGAGIRASARTTRKGRVTITVKPRFKAKVWLQVQGQRSSCARTTIVAR